MYMVGGVFVESMRLKFDSEFECVYSYHMYMVIILPASFMYTLY